MIDPDRALIEYAQELYKSTHLNQGQVLKTVIELSQIIRELKNIPQTLQLREMLEKILLELGDYC